ncbi:hypothetical protein [Archangium violaceum]|uniref:hypothetical protein n=1 Tax=Archangium violaceum TaxID=83451 RepID=UPI001269C383|nr:hypothetical protein [Archangium violaceum]
MSRNVWTRILVVLAALPLGACTTFSGGHIPPSAFEFHDIVSHEGKGPGGWKVAQVNILLSRASQRRPLYAWCDVEVGVPFANKQRSISNTVAQQRASGAADESARVVLLGHETVTAIACEHFRLGMSRRLNESIKGVKVTKFATLGIKPRSFPED